VTKLNHYLFSNAAYLSCGFILLLMGRGINAQTITWLQHDAEVWQRSQTITGKIDTTGFQTGVISWNNGVIPIEINDADSSFRASIPLKSGLNWFVACVTNQDTALVSDTLRLELKLSLKPVPEAFATVENRNVTLHGRIIENPDSLPVSFQWTEDLQNPAELGLNGSNGPLVQLTIPDQAPSGEYYFNLMGISSEYDTVRARTMITVSPDSVTAFDIRRDHAAWINDAVIYEITPYAFVMEGRFPDIQAKLSELRELGINTIWLQPVCKTKWGEHGYDVIDYFTVRSDYGTEQELHDLIKSAHTLGMRVLFDIVINHSSIYHRYAQHSLEYGTASHYYHYYQRDRDDAPYSQHYSHYKGFINYFWDELPNFNYNNPEVRNWMTAACQYWLEEFDIDGYRFDAVWGVNARCPEFTQNLRLVLKRIKPEIMLLAEDKASWSMVFDKRFDVAFDWAPGEGWVSQWYWEIDYRDWWTGQQLTIFNALNPQDRVNRLRNVLNNYGTGYAENALILRFIGNNDMIPFLRNHNLTQTKMVATLIFTLNGVPMLYNGQEIGYNTHPYESYGIFQRSKTIRSRDIYGLFDFYQYLCQIRQKYAALRSPNIREIPVQPAYYAYAFQRQAGAENLFGIINMMADAKNITLSLPVAELNLDSTKTYYLSDLITGTVHSGTVEQLANVDMTIPGYTTSLLLLADSMVIVNVKPDDQQVTAYQFNLAQNYPNPFNPYTHIRFELPQAGLVKLSVYDLLGHEVQTLVHERMPAGAQQIVFDGAGLPSGVYLCRLSFNNHSLTRKILLVK